MNEKNKNIIKFKTRYVLAMWDIRILNQNEVPRAPMGSSISRRIFSIFLYSTGSIKTSLVNQMVAQNLLKDIDKRIQETRKQLIKYVTTAKKNVTKNNHEDDLHLDNLYKQDRPDDLYCCDISAGLIPQVAGYIRLYSLADQIAENLYKQYCLGLFSYNEFKKKEVKETKPIRVLAASIQNEIKNFYLLLDSDKEEKEEKKECD